MSVTFAQGFSAAGVAAGISAVEGKKDLALVVNNGPLDAAAGVFTSNRFCAAPVQWSRNIVSDGHVKAVILNSGGANACTGKPGYEQSKATAEKVAGLIGAKAEDVAVCSTGLIGELLPLDNVLSGADKAFETLADTAEAGADASHAIMTTDTKPKTVELEGSNGFRIGGMVKGSGMIQPDMATMLAVITTDMPVAPETMRSILRTAVDVSFNKVTVDSDTSTNDSVFFFSSGVGAPVADADAASVVLGEAVRIVCEDLARQIAADGEGATKLVTVYVRDAASEADADKAARTIANSPLVKTAIAGRDCNWGRIAAALGRSGARFDQYAVDIDIMGMPVLRAGLPCGFDEDEALRRFEADEIVIEVSLGTDGDAATRVWTCDLTHEYIHINADYRS